MSKICQDRLQPPESRLKSEDDEDDWLPALRKLWLDSGYPAGQHRQVDNTGAYWNLLDDLWRRSNCKYPISDFLCVPACSSHYCNILHEIATYFDFFGCISPTMRLTINHRMVSTGCRLQPL